MGSAKLKSKMFATPSKCTVSVTKTSLLLHLCGTLWYSFTVYHDQMYHGTYQFERYGGRAQFLTMITLYLTLFASAFAFIVDCLQYTSNCLDGQHMTKYGYKLNSSRLIGLRDELMTPWVVTLCTVVPMLYWGIAAIDLKGIHPDELEKITPLFGWFNHALHTLPCVYALLLTFFVNYEYLWMEGVFMRMALFISAYIGWMSHCAKKNGVWAYDIIESQSNIEFVIFLLICILVLVVLNLCNRKIATAVWNEKRKEEYFERALKEVVERKEE